MPYRSFLDQYIVNRRIKAKLTIPANTVITFFTFTEPPGNYFEFLPETCDDRLRSRDSIMQGRRNRLRSTITHQGGRR